MGLGTTLSGGKPSVDLSILNCIAEPDPESQRKCEALGLPDPIAFAALTALGAIPNPMAMLNKMMTAAQERIEMSERGEVLPPSGATFTPPSAGPGPARIPKSMEVGSRAPAGPAGQAPSAPAGSHPPPLAVPPGKSFVQAFQEMQKTTQVTQEDKFTGLFAPLSGYASQRSRQQQADAEGQAEAERQARIAAEQARKAASMAAQTATANRDASGAFNAGPFRVAPRDTMESKGIAHIFGAAEEDPPNDSAKAPSKVTLSSLLTGRQDGGSGLTSGGAGFDKICISKLPQGITESAVRLECARNGAVTSVILDATGLTAYVGFAAGEMASMAVKRLTGRTGLFNGLAADVVQVKLISDIPATVRVATLPGPTLAEVEELVDPNDLPEYLRPKEERKKDKGRRSRSRKSRSKKRKRSRSRRRKRSRSNWLDRSRSNSHTATGQYIRATGCSSTVRWWEKKKQASSSSSSSSSSGSGRKRKKSKRGLEEEAKGRPRQVAVKGNWAQFVQHGMSYYYNVLTGKTSWDRPSDFDAVPSRRPWEVQAAQAAEEASRATRITSCFL